MNPIESQYDQLTKEIDKLQTSCDRQLKKFESAKLLFNKYNIDELKQTDDTESNKSCFEAQLGILKSHFDTLAKFESDLEAKQIQLQSLSERMQNQQQAPRPKLKPKGKPKNPVSI